MTNDAADAALARHLGRWTEAGLISAEQAQHIAVWERGRGAGPKPSLAVEALAYIGGAVIVAAISVIAVGYWDTMGLGLQLAIPGAALALSIAAGIAVPRRWGDVGVRMRAALWLIAPAAVLVVCTVLTERADRDYRVSMLIEAVPVAALAAVLWAAHRVAAQQVAAFVGTQMLGVALLQWGWDLGGDWTGLVFVLIALAWGAAALRRLLPGTGRWLEPAGAWAGPAALADRQQRWALGLAAAGATFGGIILGFGHQTAWAGVAAVAVVVAVGVARSDLMMLIIGAVGTVIVLPAVTDQYLDSTLATAAVLLVVGAVMVGLAIIVARRQSRRDGGGPRPAAGYSR